MNDVPMEADAVKALHREFSDEFAGTTDAVNRNHIVVYGWDITAMLLAIRGERAQVEAQRLTWGASFSELDNELEGCRETSFKAQRERDDARDAQQTIWRANGALHDRLEIEIALKEAAQKHFVETEADRDRLLTASLAGVCNAMADALGLPAEEIDPNRLAEYVKQLQTALKDCNVYLQECKSASNSANVELERMNWSNAQARTALETVRDQVERMMAAAKPIGEGEWVESYHIEPGALHYMAGLVRGGAVTAALDLLPPLTSPTVPGTP